MLDLKTGNFINGELWGKPTDSQLGFLVNGIVRHPSQLYEAALEGLLLFLVINWFARKPRLYGHVTGLFLILYGIFRFAVEFVRQPDAQFLGQSSLVESFSWMTRGQTLCIPMILLGFWFMRKSLQQLFDNSVSSS